MISGACTRHAHKPLFENLPACRRRGGKFRVFSAFFGDKPGNRRLSDQYFAISGRSLSPGRAGPDAPQVLRDPGAAHLTAPWAYGGAYDGGTRHRRARCVPGTAGARSGHGQGVPGGHRSGWAAGLGSGSARQRGGSSNRIARQRHGPPEAPAEALSHASPREGATLIRRQFLPLRGWQAGS
jgi:hypothetical protein